VSPSWKHEMLRLQLSALQKTAETLSGSLVVPSNYGSVDVFCELAEMLSACREFLSDHKP
jgi:hypothetical protein